MIGAESFVIFADGSCLGNPGPGGWGAIVEAKNRVWELGGGAENTTNNEMELMGLYQALLFCADNFGAGRISVYLDSQYVLNGAEKWVHSWRRKAWKTADGSPVKNLELWKLVADCLDKMKAEFHISWLYVPGHEGIPGNERVDEIASSFAANSEPFLFEGPLSEYSVSLHEGLSELGPAPNRMSKPSFKAKKYYLSVVGGEVYRDETWPACQARVQGVSGAKYKKVSSKKEEEQALKIWGVKPRNS